MSDCSEITENKEYNCSDYKYQPRWAHIFFDEESGLVFDEHNNVIGVNGRFNQDRTGITMEPFKINQQPSE